MAPIFKTHPDPADTEIARLENVVLQRDDVIFHLQEEILSERRAHEVTRVRFNELLCNYDYLRRCISDAKHALSTADGPTYYTKAEGQC